MDGINMSDNVILVKCSQNDDNFTRFIEAAKERDNDIQNRRIIIRRSDPTTQGKFTLYLHGPQGHQLMKLDQFDGKEMDIIFQTDDQYSQKGGYLPTYYDKYLKYKKKYLQAIQKY
jgi:hypothetical protein